MRCSRGSRPEVQSKAMHPADKAQASQRRRLDHGAAPRKERAVSENEDDDKKEGERNERKDDSETKNEEVHVETEEKEKAKETKKSKEEPHERERMTKLERASGRRY